MIAMNPSQWLAANLTQVLMALAQAGAALESAQPQTTEPNQAAQ